MIQNADQLRTSLEQMGRLLRSLDDLKQNVLPKDPTLFAAMAESPIDDLNQIRHEMEEYLRELRPVGQDNAGQKTQDGDNRASVASGVGS